MDDHVSGLVGWNSSTGGTTKDGGKWGIVKGAATVISGATTTAHNCYGVGTADCAEADLLNDRKPLNWESVYKPKDASDVVMPNNDKTTVTE